MRKLFRFAGPALLLAVLVGAPPATAQQSGDDVAAEIEALKKGQQDIQKQLAEIKRLIQTQAKPQQPARRGPEVEGVVFDLGDNLVEGSSDATLALLEFTDYQ